MQCFTPGSMSLVFSIFFLLFFLKNKHKKLQAMTNLPACAGQWISSKDLKIVVVEIILRVSVMSNKLTYINKGLRSTIFLNFQMQGKQYQVKLHHF